MIDDSRREPAPASDDPWLGLLEMALHVPPDDEAPRRDRRGRTESRRTKRSD